MCVDGASRVGGMIMPHSLPPLLITAAAGVEQTRCRKGRSEQPTYCPSTGDSPRVARTLSTPV